MHRDGNNGDSTGSCLERNGHENMDNTISEVLSFVEENDVKFIRLAFCDLFGVHKNITIMPSELPRAFTRGISFEQAAVDGFREAKEDLYLFPDPGTVSVLPWRPSQGPGRPTTTGLRLMGQSADMTLSPSHGPSCGRWPR